jgi:hypothetical protein
MKFTINSPAGGLYTVLAIRVRGVVVQSNTIPRNLLSTFYYRYISGAVPTVGSKVGLVTNVAGPTSGFQAVVFAKLLLALNNRYTNVSIDSRWMDTYEDQWQAQVTAGGVGAVAGDSLPLEDCVTIRKNTGIRGKSYKGSWHFAPASESDTTKDELNAGGIATWVTALRPTLAANISDNLSTFGPVLLSQSSKLGVNLELPYPLNIVGADLVGPLPVNLTIGDMKKRKERPSTTA